MAVAWLTAPKLRLMVDVEWRDCLKASQSLQQWERVGVGEGVGEGEGEGVSMLQHLVADLATLSHDLKISSWRQVIKTNVTGKQLA